MKFKYIKGNILRRCILCFAIYEHKGKPLATILYTRLPIIIKDYLRFLDYQRFPTIIELYLLSNYFILLTKLKTNII